MDRPVVLSLLWIARAGVLLVPLLPLATGGLPWGGWLVDPTYYPDIVPRSVLFRLLVEVMVVVWAMLACLDPRYRPRLRGTLAALLAFTAVIGLCSWLGYDSELAVWSNLQRMKGWIELVHLLGFFVVATAVMTNQRLWSAFFHVSFGVAAIVAVTTWLQLLAPASFPLHQHLPQRSWFRADAWLGNAVYVAIYLNGHLFLAALWALRALAAKRRAAAVGYALLGLLYFTGTYHTATRAATYLAAPLGIAVIAVLVLLTSRQAVRVRRAAIAALALAVVATGTIALLAVLAPDVLWHVPGTKRLLALSHSLEGRDLVWGVALKGVWDHPFLGWGPENFGYVFDRHYDPALWRYDPWYDHPHNVFLGWAVAGGVVGFVAFLVLFFSPLPTLWRRTTAAFSTIDRCVLTGWLVSHAAILAFVFDNLNSHLLFLGIAAWIHTAGYPVAAAERQLRWRWLAVPVGALAVVAMVWVVEPRAVAQPWRASKQLARVASFRKQVEAGQPVPAEWMPQVMPEAQKALAESEGTLAEEEGVHEVFGFDVAIAKAKEVPEDLKQRLRDMALLIQSKLVAQQQERGTPSVSALLDLAKELAAQGRTDEALTYGRQALALSPDRELVLRDMAELQHRAGHEAAARKLLEHAAEVAPGSRKVRSALAAVAIRTGDTVFAWKLMSQLYGKGTRPFAPVPGEIVDAAYRFHHAALLVPIYERRVKAMRRMLHKGGRAAKSWQFDHYKDLALAYVGAQRPADAAKIFEEMARRFPSRAKSLRAAAAAARAGCRLQPKADGNGFELAPPRAPQTPRRTPRHRNGK